MRTVYTQSLAACAALFLTLTSIATIVSVPNAHAAAVAPMLA